MLWNNPALALWGKTDRQKVPKVWHPLIGHSLDVAASFWKLLEREPQRTRELFAQELGLPLHTLLPWGAALAGMHDVGKAMPNFQLKWEAEGGRLVALDLLRASGFAWSRLDVEGRPIPHGTASQAFLQEALLEYGLLPEVARRLADALEVIRKLR